MKSFCGSFVALLICLSVVQTVWTKDVIRDKRDDKATKLIVTTIHEPPYVEYNTKKSGNERFQGLIPDMMKKIGKELSLLYEFQLLEDGTYGTENNEQWNGMIGEIISGDADIAAAPITVSAERSKVVDFTTSFEDFSTVLLMLKNEDGSDSSITSLAQLADQDEISYGVVKNGVTQNFFKNTNNVSYQKMWGNMQSRPQNSMDTVEDGVTKVRNSDGKYAFIMESATADYWVDKEPCDLEVVSDNINKNHFAFALQKGDTENKEKIDRVLNNMKTSGELDRMVRNWKKGQCGHITEAPSAAAAFGTGSTQIFLGFLLSSIVFNMS